jgi:hypothetical protein
VDTNEDQVTVRRPCKERAVRSLGIWLGALTTALAGLTWMYSIPLMFPADHQEGGAVGALMVAL